MKRNVFKIVSVFFLATSLFAGGVTVATCRSHQDFHVCCATVCEHGTHTGSCTFTVGMEEHNLQHKLGQCRGTGLCYGYLVPGKTIVSFLRIAGYGTEVPLPEMPIPANIVDPAYFIKPSPMYILNLSFLF